MMVMSKISAIIDLLSNLANQASINNEFIILLIKITGIAFLTEFAVSICKDSGETAIATKVDMRWKSGYHCYVYSYYFRFIRNSYQDTTVKENK